MNQESRVKDKGLRIKDGASQGFAALMIAIVMSLVLLVITVSLNQSGFLTRSIISESEFKEQSAGLAEACADYAILKLANDPSYAGNETLSYGIDSCFVRNTQFDLPINGKITIETTATKRNAITNLRIVVSQIDLTIESWDEVASF